MPSPKKRILKEALLMFTKQLKYIFKQSSPIYGIIVRRLNYKSGGINIKHKSNNKNKTSRTNKREWIETIIIGIVVIVINVFVFNITIVSGDSMNPTLENGDRLILKKYETLLNTEEYNRGDIVAFKSPIEKDKRFFIKRVVGVPGDRINIIEGNLYINGEYINESYVENESFTEAYSFGENFIVPEDSIFVMGDNRFPGGSNDSRSFGGVSVEAIKGKVVLRIFPFNKINKTLK